MANEVDIKHLKQWTKRIHQRYVDYLTTSFFFSDPDLRRSFRDALGKEGRLQKEASEEHFEFKKGMHAHQLAEKIFAGKNVSDLKHALIGDALYDHQEQAIKNAFAKQKNLVVATGTASGKTESFLYPILFELFRQHLAGDLKNPGVRAMILYPMNALANDQRERLGEICKKLKEAGSQFKPTFGQYIGQTPEDEKNEWRNASEREKNRLDGELVFRKEMRDTPPHILLTNYSMLEYLLIRPKDTPLFDGDRGAHWQFLVLDEAHQYRGAKGMEIGMLMRRLKQRLRDGGRQDSFRCIATSATMSSRENQEDRKAIAEFAKKLFNEPFAEDDIIFGKREKVKDESTPSRHHAFLRGLQGAFLVHKNGKDTVALNRKDEDDSKEKSKPLEIALCRECGQHYYVGKEQGGKLREGIRDPSHEEFGVDYYLPDETGKGVLCRRCGALAKSSCDCKKSAFIPVKKCKSHKEHPDELKKCEACGYGRGSIGDPVREIVHGSDGPGSVIATTLHELLPADKRKILAFADSRQRAAFFAWYIEDSYRNILHRNLIYRAMNSEDIADEGLTINDLTHCVYKLWEKIGLFEKPSASKAQKSREVSESVLREAVTDDKRRSLSGVGLVKWSVKLHPNLKLPPEMLQSPWNFSEDEARTLIGYLLDNMRSHQRAISLPEDSKTAKWADISPYEQKPKGKTLVQWCNTKNTIVGWFLHRILDAKESGLSDEEKHSCAAKLLRKIWYELRDLPENDPMLMRISSDAFLLNCDWVRVELAKLGEIWRCEDCTTLSSHNILDICSRKGCRGMLKPVDEDKQKVLEGNHYRKLYKNAHLPPKLSAKEHTAQIEANEAAQRQSEFKDGKIHLLSSSTTFELGVDLGDLDCVFLRNVPPEPFNYVQRAGRAGRRDDSLGLVLTYCDRNPHDLYHYEDPERIMKGEVRPPQLRMTNHKIVSRHMVAAVLSEFFRAHPERFESVESFVGDWKNIHNPQVASDIHQFCRKNSQLKESLCRIVDQNMHEKVGLRNDAWIDEIAGKNSRLVKAVIEVLDDYKKLEELLKKPIEEAKHVWRAKRNRIEERQDTIKDDRVLDFLSRKAVIPKYGFPVDVVELDIHSSNKNVSLQRDLSQAIGEYAAGSKVVADKKEWIPYGIKTIAGKRWKEQYYHYTNARDFKNWSEGESEDEKDKQVRQYLIPEFGFVTEWFKKAPEPRRGARRLYTTRPFFPGFKDQKELESKNIAGVNVTPATPGTLVILCEGRKRNSFYICRACGTQSADRKIPHKTPWGSTCRTPPRPFSLGHELETDVVCLHFPNLCDEWESYSVAYAMLLGAADRLGVPDNDLNVTITGGKGKDEYAVVLYDNVPGGAGLVAQLEKEDVFCDILKSAEARVQGQCGCDSSCYGCLRSYRNQFAHADLNRQRAKEILESCVGQMVEQASLPSLKI